VKIRRATTGDIPPIIDIGHHVWPATHAFAGDDYISHGLAT
jgi:hypothetical protein